jgi:hypothetical protein
MFGYECYFVYEKIFDGFNKKAQSKIMIGLRKDPPQCDDYKSSCIFRSQDAIKFIGTEKDKGFERSGVLIISRFWSCDCH